MYVIIIIFSKIPGGSKQKLITRLAKHFIKEKRNSSEVLEEKINYYFEDIGPKGDKSNHQMISGTYAKNFNSIDKFNEYV